MSTAIKRLYTGSPAVLGVPALAKSFVYATTGGSIAAGTVVSYRITARSGTTETLASTAVTFTVPAGTNTNTVTPTWVPVPGASDYRVYGRTSGSELLMATVTVNYWLDAGSVTPSGALPGSSGFAEVTATPGLYTPPTAKSAMVRDVSVSNPTATPGQVYLSVVPSGNTSGAANRILSGSIVNPDSWGGAPFKVSTLRALANGDFLAGYVTVPGMVIFADGLEIG